MGEGQRSPAPPTCSASSSSLGLLFLSSFSEYPAPSLMGRRWGRVRSIHLI